MRLAVAGLMHETNVFSSLPTTDEDFTWSNGTEMLTRFADTKTEVGGILNAAKALGVEVEPMAYADAIPGGVVDHSVCEHFVGGLVEALKRAQPDAVVLVLHGAMVTDEALDPEGEILRATREVLGRGKPIIATLDFHANISRAMVDHATALLGYDTNPHVDMYEKGWQAVELASLLVKGSIKVHSNLIRVPMLTMMINQATTAGPMKEIAARATLLKRTENVLAANVYPGFWPSDTPATGLNVLVVRSSRDESKGRLDGELAEAAWNERARLAEANLLDPEEAMGLAAVNGGTGPSILCDIGDITGAGAPGDSAFLLRKLLAAGSENSVFASVVDPVAAERLRTLRVGSAVCLRLGGSLSPDSASVEVKGCLKAKPPGTYVRGGARASGVIEDRGPTALIQCGGVEIIVTAKRVMPDTVEYFSSLGIDPTEKSILAMKASVHFRAAFEPIAAKILLVDTPGPSNPTARFQGRAFQRVVRPCYPIDADVSFAPFAAP